MKQTILPRGFKTKAEKTSLDIRKQLGIQHTEACPARKVALLYGISVTEVDKLIQIVKSNQIDEFQDGDKICENLLRLCGPDCGFSATAVIIGGYRIILYNGTHSAARQESDLMHEIAHILCGHPGDDLQLNSDIPLRSHNNQYEEEAKCLGSIMQIPESGLFSLAIKGASVESIAEIFGSSIEMAIYRWRICGIDRRLSYIRKSPKR